MITFLRKMSKKIRNLKPKKKKEKKLRIGLGLMGREHGGGTGDYVLDSIRPKSAVHTARSAFRHQVKDEECQKIFLFRRSVVKTKK